MDDKSSPASRFMRTTLAEMCKPATGKVDADETAPAPLIGSMSVGGDVIFLGDVSPDALELVLGRRRAKRS